LDRGFARADQLATAFYEAVLRLEISAFDCVFLAFVTGKSSGEELSRFISDCLSLKNDHFAVDISHPDSCREYVFALRRIVDDCAGEIAGSESASINLNASLESFSREVELFQASLAQSLSDLEQKVCIPLPRYPPTIPTIEPISFSSESLRNWLFSQLPNVCDRVELADLISSVAFQLTAARSLQSNITALRHLTDFTEPPDGRICPYEAIERSPFLKVKESECRFLRDLIEFLDEDRDSLKLVKFADDLEHFSETYTKKTTATLADFEGHLKALEARLAARKKELADLWELTGGSVEVVLKAVEDEQIPPIQPLPEWLHLGFENPASGDPILYSLFL
jgi:hypothetical protein